MAMSKNVIQSAKKQISELETESQEIKQVLAELEQEHAEKSITLQGLFAWSERHPTNENVEAANAGEKEADDLDRTLVRKRAALSACNADLEKAQAGLEAATHKSIVDQIADIHKQVVAVVRKLDKNISNPSNWGELARLAQAGNRLYLGLNGGREFPEIFSDPRHARGVVFSGLAYECDRAMGVNGGGQLDRPSKVSEVMGLNLSANRIKKLQA